MTQHGNSYKLLFSHPEMARDLLSGFVHEPWVADLHYTPQLKYLLLDEGAVDESGPLALRNLSAALFSLEKSQSTANMTQIVTALISWLADPGQDSLRRAFAVWMRRVLLPGRLPGLTMPQYGRLTGG